MVHVCSHLRIQWQCVVCIVAIPLMSIEIRVRQLRNACLTPNLSIVLWNLFKLQAAGGGERRSFEGGKFELLLVLSLCSTWSRMTKHKSGVVRGLVWERDSRRLWWHGRLGDTREFFRKGTIERTMRYPTIIIMWGYVYTCITSEQPERATF